MPFYEYQCQACEAQVEVLQKISDAPLKKCPECGKSKLVKLVSAPIFRLKGGGWYETDFKSDSDRKRNLAGADKDASPASGSDAKPADSKAVTEAPAAKAEPVKATPPAKAKAKSAKKAKGGK